MSILAFLACAAGTTNGKPGAPVWFMPLGMVCDTAIVITYLLVR